MTNELKHASFIQLGFVMIMTAILVAPSSAFAHAPKEVKLGMDADMKQLSVTLTHKSPLPSWHYIKTVQITKNGTVISTQEYKNQPDKETFEYIYPVAAVAGDAIEVTATCNVTGSKSAKLIVNPTAKTP
jgi:hypothetical protein